MASMEEENYISGPSHCCKLHGCKYGLKGCPVSNGSVVQEYPCELCTWDLEDAGRVYQTNELGTRVAIGYQRRDQELTAMPTDEQVLDALAKALGDLEIAPGWHITFVGR